MRDITLCHPRLQRIASAWMKACATEGITVAISETLRTAAEQDALYAQGRTKPGNIVTNAKGSSYRSQHQWGIAFDFYLKMDIDGDGKISDDAYNDSKGHFKRAAEIAKKLGLAWGGDWKSIVDKPHLYLPDWGSTPTALMIMASASIKVTSFFIKIQSSSFLVVFSFPRQKQNAVNRQKFFVDSARHFTFLRRFLVYILPYFSAQYYSISTAICSKMTISSQSGRPAAFPRTPTRALFGHFFATQRDSARRSAENSG